MTVDIWKSNSKTKSTKSTIHQSSLQFMLFVFTIYNQKKRQQFLIQQDIGGSATVGYSSLEFASSGLEANLKNAQSCCRLTVCRTVYRTQRKIKSTCTFFRLWSAKFLTFFRFYTQTRFFAIHKCTDFVHTVGGKSIFTDQCYRYILFRQLHWEFQRLIYFKRFVIFWSIITPEFQVLLVWRHFLTHNFFLLQIVTYFQTNFFSYSEGVFFVWGTEVRGKWIKNIKKSLK